MTQRTMFKLYFLHRYLGHLYAAESLIKLDKISEAIPELVPDKVTDISTSLESSSPDKKAGNNDLHLPLHFHQHLKPLRAGGRGNFNWRVTGVCHLTSEITPQNL